MVLALTAPNLYAAMNKIPTRAKRKLAMPIIKIMLPVNMGNNPEFPQFMMLKFIDTIII